MLLFQDANQEIDFNPGLVIEKLDSWLDGFIRMLPNIGIAIILTIIFYFIAKGVAKILKRTITGHGRENLASMLSGMVKYAIFILGLLLAMTIVMPSLQVGDLVAGLGVSSVAIGFAFKDILQNWLAGLLILIRQPFEIGDQIVINGFEGTVEEIETRATIIKTYSGERIVMPNNEIYTNAVKVNTAYGSRRSQYDVGIGYGDSISDAKVAIQKVLSSVDGIDHEKGIEVLPWDLAASWVTLRVRWWTKAPQKDVVNVMSEVITQIKQSLDDAHIDMPYDTKVHLIHDQTEEGDGDRTKQREGWPVGLEQ